jgi:hypothetical protein
MTQQKEAPKGRVNSSKLCRDCEEATVHQTGSQLWISCRLQNGWRSINSTCNLPKEARLRKKQSPNKTEKKQSSFKSSSLGSVTCPKCKRVGQLKARMTRTGTRYFQVDHWKIGNNHASGYSDSCYLRCAEQEEYSLKTQNPKHRKILRIKLVGEENLSLSKKANSVISKREQKERTT